MAEVKQKVAEVAVDAAKMTEEHAHEIAEAIPDVVQSLTKMRIGFATLGMAIGAAAASFITWRLVDKKLHQKYSEEAEEEIDQMREHFRSRLVVKEEKPDLIELSRKSAGLGYSTKDPLPAGGPGAPVTKPEEPVKLNVFEEQRELGWNHFDYEHEIAFRKTLPAGYPYLIHEDERHDEDAKDYAETTLTWYAGDDILCDDDDRALPNVDELIGMENLSRFGNGTDSPEVMFIRNDRLEVIMEVNRSPNSYTEEVHGLSHSEDEPRRRRPKFPKWDD